MKFLRDIDVKNKKVLVRVDFNVPLKEGKIVDDFKIQALLPTIKYLLEQNAKIVLISHLGRPKVPFKFKFLTTKKDIQDYNLEPIAERLKKLLGQEVYFSADDYYSDDIETEISQLKSGQIVLLMNVRFYPGEINNDDEFAKRLASFGDIYVNDAFGACHRAHASIVGVPKYLPSCAGLLLEKEVKVLSNVLKNPEHPLAVVIGGAKISTKIKMIKDFLKTADDLILGGALANTVISAKGFAIGRSVSEKEMIEEVKKLQLTDIKLHIPVDVVVSTEPTGKAPIRVAPVGNTKEDEMILDIGTDTVDLFKDVLNQAKMIIINGSMGLFEVEEFSNGSRQIFEAIANSKGFSVVGGGDSVALLNQLNIKDKISHISTGGGAMLKFLSGEKLPGIEALNL